MPQIRQPTTRLLVEYLLHEFPQGGWRTNVALGPLAAQIVQEMGEGLATGLLRPFRPKVDAILFLPGRLILIESKDLRWRDGLGNLVVYRSLVPSTPELAPFRDRSVEAWLLLPWTVPAAEVAARELGITIRVFTPAWYGDRLRDLNLYWTADYRRKRDELKRLRDALGVGERE